MARTFRRSPLALAVLGLLYEAPMHPYRMQQLIKQRNKDKVINVQRRASLYQTIEQLQRAGLIAVQSTVRHEKRPERTIYGLTDKGRQTAVAWIRDILATPIDEFPEFPAAVSFMPLLPTGDALQQLELRESALQTRIAAVKDGLHTGLAQVPRLFLLEEELSLAILEAELIWVRGILYDLRTGELTWSVEWLRSLSASQPDE